MKKVGLYFAALAVFSFANVSRAATTIAIDEFGNMQINGNPGPPGFLANDIGPGGLPGTLHYLLPFPDGVKGDVHLADADAGGAFLDVLRFNGDGTVIFYSDNVDGFDAPADTPGPPGAQYPNTITINEIGPSDQLNGAVYTPTPNQPGFDPTLLSQPTYVFVSDGTIAQFEAFVGIGVPVPAASKLGLAALGLLAAQQYLRRRAKAG